LANVPPLPYPLPIVVNHGQKRRGGERPAPGAVRAAPLLLPHGRPAVRGESRQGRAEPQWRYSPPATAVERRDNYAARSPDATVGDGSRRGAGDDVCGAATGPTAV